MDRDLLRPAIIAVGITLAGLLIGGGFARGRAADRYVTVKGISERESGDASGFLRDGRPDEPVFR
ncbi:MAG: hypothetical protein ACR2GK_05030 [Gemmatimonadaceae bacterium]